MLHRGAIEDGTQFGQDMSLKQRPSDGRGSIFMPQSLPVHPGGHTHVLFGPEHLPPFLHAHACTLQSGPVHPGGHVHVFGPEHAPPFLQGTEHADTLQSGPVHPGGHVHVFGPEHVPPFLQGTEHADTLQSGPAHWGGHVHVEALRLVHTPSFWHLILHGGFSQLGPVHPSTQLHSP